MDSNFNDIARRYVGVWNEADSEVRRRVLKALFAPDVAHFTPSREAHGHAEMEQRIVSAHKTWVHDGGYRFAPLGDAEGHHDVVRLRWQMIPAAGGPAVSVGSDVLILAQDGSIKFDYQFIDET